MTDNDRREPSRARRDSASGRPDRPSTPGRSGEWRPRRDGAPGQGGEARPRRDGDSRPRREGDAAPRREGEWKPRRDGDAAPRRDGDSRPRREGEWKPRREGDSAPRRDGDSRPRRDGEWKPRRDGDQRPRRDDDSRPRRDGEQRPPRAERSGPKVVAPDLPEDVTAAELDKDARGRLRTLSKDNAEDVGRHLVMAGRLLDEDPELAYRHAQTAVARAGRVDVVREAAAIAAYATGRYAEALREFRTVTRLNGSHEHLALVADCERGLGRPERALELAASPEASTLSSEAKAELQMVVAGARSDLGQYDAALLTLERIKAVDADQAARVREAHDAIIARRDGRGAATEAGTGADVAAGGGTAGGPAVDDIPGSAHISADEDDEVVVYDLEDGDDD